MASSPTYESYCRERKASVDKQRFIDKGRAMSEVVDEILEIISTDEELLVVRKAKREASMLTTDSSFATWSLSSSAIMTSWPSGSTADDNDDGFDTVSKSIQSYTSQLFSPLYEVRPEQHNVFQENRKPLPKAGNTPKVRNLCYNLATELSYDEANDYQLKPKQSIRRNVSSKQMSSPRNQRAHHATERILLSVSPLSVMTNAEIAARDTKVGVDQFSLTVPKQLTVRPDDTIVSVHDEIPPSQDNEIMDRCSHQQPIQLPAVYDDDVYARKDWMLKTFSSVDSGELSLEPLLNAYSEDFDSGALSLEPLLNACSEDFDSNALSVEPLRKVCPKNFDPKELLISDRQVLDRTDELTNLETDKIDPVDAVTDPQNNEIIPSPNGKSQWSVTKETPTDVIQNINTPKSSSNKKCETSDETQCMSQILTIQAVENIYVHEKSFLQRITIDVPLTPSLLHVVDTSLTTLQSMIAKSLLGCSVLVRLEKKRISTEEALVDFSTTPNGWLVSSGDQTSGNNDNGCFSIDLDTCCLQKDDGKHPMDNISIFDCGPSGADCQKFSFSSKQLIEFPSQPTNGSTTSKKIDTSTTPDNFVDHFKPEPIRTTSEAPIETSEKLDCRNSSMPSISSIRSSETNSEDIVEKFLRAIERTEYFGFDIDVNGETDSILESIPKSFDSEQFMRDMEFRLDADLSLGSYCEDDTSISTIFQQLSMNLPSVPCESNDGLDEEIYALETFGVELQNELEKADDRSVLAPLTSPINTQLTPHSSTCSITTTFLSDVHVLSYNSSNDDFIYPVAPPNVRKVHFNEQVEEFLYFTHEACGTPDAKEAVRQKTDETFMDEICNVFDDILDELNFACVSISRAMDRTRYLSKSKTIRRSSVS